MFFKISRTSYSLLTFIRFFLLSCGGSSSDEASGDVSIDKHKISSCNWSIADKEELAAALKPNASATGNWSENNLTTSGKLVRQEIRRKNKEY